MRSYTHRRIRLSFLEEDRAVLRAGALAALGDLPLDRAAVGPREHGVRVAGAQRS